MQKGKCQDEHGNNNPGDSLNKKKKMVADLRIPLMESA
jgi:hypothetical protein